MTPDEKSTNSQWKNTSSRIPSRNIRVMCSYIFGTFIAFCNEKGTLRTICPLITGDALLYSMFRETGNPMLCPFKPPYTFTYNRGHGDCKNPISTVEACTQDSRLMFRYQACPDVEGSESARKYYSYLLSMRNFLSNFSIYLRVIYYFGIAQSCVAYLLNIYEAKNELLKLFFNCDPKPLNSY